MAGRPPTPATEQVKVTLNTDALAADAQALTIIGKRQAEIAERFGDGQPYDRLRVVSEAKFFMAASAEAMLEAGKRLIQIKENEPHGEFVAICEEQLGLNRRTAQVMMQAAAKYLSPKLDSKAQTFALLGRSKLLNLMTEDDDDLAALAEGGTLAGLTLPEVETMSVRELKQALRDRDQQLTAKDKLIAKRDAKISRLEEAAEAAEGEETAQLKALQERVAAAHNAILQLGTLIGELDAAGASENLRNVVNNDSEFLAQVFAEMLTSAGVPVQFEESVNPSYMPADLLGKKARKG